MEFQHAARGVVCAGHGAGLNQFVLVAHVDDGDTGLVQGLGNRLGGDLVHLAGGLRTAFA